MPNGQAQFDSDGGGAQDRDWGAILRSDNFRGLPPDEKARFLRSYVPGYKELPPQEQVKFLRQVMYPGTQEPEKPGMASELAGVAERAVSGLYKTGMQAFFNPTGLLTDTYQSVKPIATGEAYKERRKEGYGRAYAALAPPAAMATGVNLPSMEQAAREGRIAGVLAEAAVPAATVVAGAAGKEFFGPEMTEARAMRATPAMLEKGQRGMLQFLRETPGKGGAKASAMARDVDIATKSGDLPQIFRDAPITEKNARAVGEVVDKIDDYQDRLWNGMHEAPVSRHPNAPVDTQGALRESLSEIEPADRRVSSPAQIRSAETWLKQMFKPGLTVAEADAAIRRLNTEIKQPPEAWGPIGARVRMTALRQLRQRVDETLTANGEVSIREANQRWGALDHIKEKLAERYAQQWLKDANKPAIPSWMHAYAFANAHRLAIGLGARLAGMLAPGEVDAFIDAGKSYAGARVPPAQLTTSARMPIPPGRQLPGPGETTTTLYGTGERAPGGPRTTPPPLTGREATPEERGMAIVRRPDLGKQAPGGPRSMPPPPEMPPSEGAAPLARIPGHTYQEAASAGVRTPPPGYSSPASMSPIPEVEAHMAGLLRAGKISRGEIMRMTRLGVLGQGAATRIFKLAGK